VTETPAVATSYTFDPFARHQFYHDVNQSLVRQAIGRLDADRPAGQHVRVVELASGTGAVTELILDELERLGRPATVVGVEPSAEAIAIARDYLDRRGVMFVQGDADELKRAGSDVDIVFFCNAIHLVPDKSAALRKIVQVLAPQGFFACNSSFYEGAYAPGSERFYRLWTRRAMGWLRENHPGVRPSRTEKATAMQWLTPEQYVAVLEENGMRPVVCEQETAQMPLRAWQDIGRYWLFIEGALPSIPIPLGADALEHGAAEAFQELGLTHVPRVWLQLVAHRNGEGQ
jgi:ubiquinone/menaquinone biosynthesis C-methylase UbiE